MALYLPLILKGLKTTFSFKVVLFWLPNIFSFLHKHIPLPWLPFLMQCPVVNKQLLFSSQHVPCMQVTTGLSHYVL